MSIIGPLNLSLLLTSPRCRLHFQSRKVAQESNFRIADHWEPMQTTCLQCECAGTLPPLSATLLIRRLDSQHKSVSRVSARGTLRGYVKVAVGALLDVTNALLQRHEQPLPPLGLRGLVEGHTHQLPLGERADEKVILPLRKLIAGVKHDAGRADRRHPENPGIVHAGPRPRLLGNRRPGVVAAGGHKRPAVVKAGVKAVGGKLESMYYCFGKDDVVVIMDLADNVAAASLVTAVGASGLVRARTTPLLTVEEMDKALAKKVGYKGPGSAK